MTKEEILKGVECCAEFLCGECPYQKYENPKYLLKCNTALMRDVNELLKNTTLPPAYVGQTIYRIRGKWGYADSDTLHENYKILSWYTVEGKVSMIQQKADKSWKIRMSEGGSVSDYTININQIGELIFFDKEEAEKKAQEKTNGI